MRVLYYGMLPAPEGELYSRMCIFSEIAYCPYCLMMDDVAGNSVLICCHGYPGVMETRLTKDCMMEIRRLCGGPRLMMRDKSPSLPCPSPPRSLYITSRCIKLMETGPSKIKYYKI